MNRSTTSHFAEVIESSIATVTGQSWRWEVLPTFGSLVEISTAGEPVFGFVTSIATGSHDAVRQPFTYRKTEAELHAQHPEIFQFLQTTFGVQVAGYQEHHNMFYVLPPKPCKIHAFIKECSPQTYEKFFERADYLHLLFAFQDNVSHLDELLLALLRNAHTQKVLPQRHLDEFCKLYSLLTNNNYKRLKLFLQRVQQLLAP